MKKSAILTVLFVFFSLNILQGQVYKTVHVDTPGILDGLLIEEENTGVGERIANPTVSAPGITTKTISLTQFCEPAVLSVSATTLDVGYSAGSTETFDITSNISWNVNSDQAWLTPDPASGSNDATITLTAEANPATSTRIATVTVSASGVESKTITVTQQAAPAVLSVSTTALDVGYSAGSTETFDITSNISWNVNSDQVWLTPNPASGSNDATITLTAEANPAASTRSAIVTVSASGVESKTITVTQQAAPAVLSVSATALDVGYSAGSTETFDITSNTSWNVNSDQAWLILSPASGSGNATITLTAEANPAASTRSATVTVSASGVESKTITVTQAELISGFEEYERNSIIISLDQDNDLLYIEGTSNTVLNIYNMQGQLLISEYLESSTENINLSALLPGLYLIQTGNQVFKIIKR